MNKKIVYGMIALLSVSFLFLGCPTGTSSDSSTVTQWPDDDTSGGGLPPVDPKQAAAALASALGGGAVSTGSSVLIPPAATVTITRATEIPVGVTLSLDSTATLKVPDLSQLTNNGTIVLDGTLDLTTTITPAPPLTNAGTLELNASVTVPNGIVNSGTITVDTGETLTVTAGGITHSGTGEIGGAGVVTITTGGLTNNGTLDVNVGTLTMNGGAVTNEGTLIVTESFTAPSVTNSGNINVPTNGKTLTVTAGITHTGGTGEISGAGGVVIGNGFAINGGTLTVGVPTLTITAGGITNNGTLTLTSDITSLTYTTGALTNGGTLNVGTDVTVPSGSGLINSGNITVATGKELEVSDTGFTHSGTGAISGLGTVTISGDGLTTNAASSLDVSVATFDITGALTNGGELTVNSPAFTFTGLLNNTGTLNVNEDFAAPVGITNTGGTITVAGGDTLTVDTVGITNAAGTGAINGDGTVAITAGGLTNAGTLTVGANVTIAGDNLVNNDTDSALTVAQGGTIALGSSAGNITNSKSIVIAGTLSSEKSGATNTNTGTITVNTTGALTTATDVDTSGGTIIVQGTGTVTGASSIVFVGTSGKILPGSGGVFTYGSTISVAGPVSVIDNYYPTGPVTLAANGALTITGTKTLALSTYSITGVVGAQIIIETDGVISITTSNFYLSTVTTPDTPPLAGKTYDWDATDAGGNVTTPGWERTS